MLHKYTRDKYIHTNIPTSEACTYYTHTRDTQTHTFTHNRDTYVSHAPIIYIHTYILHTNVHTHTQETHTYT